VLESQNVAKALDNHLAYHENARQNKNDAMFDSVDGSKRCISAATFLKKCLQESTIFSYDIVSIPYLFSKAKKASFDIVGHNSDGNEIDRSSQVRCNLDTVHEYKALRSLDQDNINDLNSYSLEVQAPAFWQLYPFGPWRCCKQNPRRVLGFRSETDQTPYEVNTNHMGKDWKLAVILCAFNERAAGQPDREIQKLEHILHQTGYTILYATEKQFCKEHFDEVIKKVREKLPEGICGIKVWIIAHGEERATEYCNYDEDTKKMTTIRVNDVYIKTDDENEVKVSDFLKDMSAIAQESRKSGRHFPVICNICCCRAMRQDDMTEGEIFFAQTPSDLLVMYSASSGQFTQDNSTFIDEWVKFYGYDFKQKELQLVASEIQNNVERLNEEQRPRFEQNLRYSCKNGIYVLPQHEIIEQQE